MSTQFSFRPLASALAGAALIAASGAALAADKITIMVGGYEKQIYLPAKLAEGLGYFKAEGLDVELLNEPSGVDAEDEMLAGAVQGVVGFYDHCVDLQTKGKYAQSVVQFSQAPGEVELVSTKHPEIKSMADLRGKSLGVTGLGSSTNFLSQYLMVKSGVPLGEFTSLPVGAGTTFIAAMQQDKIQAGMTTEPTISRLLKTGEARVLVDMRSIEKPRLHWGAPTLPHRSTCPPSGWRKISLRCKSWRMPLSKRSSSSIPTPLLKLPTRCPRTSMWVTKRATSRHWRTARACSPRTV